MLSVGTGLESDFGPSARGQCRQYPWRAGDRVTATHHLGAAHLVGDSLVESFEAALAVLRGAGAELVESPLPLYAEITAANYVLMLSEALAFHLPALKERWADFGRSTRQLLSGGLAYSGPDYVQAQRIRAESWLRAQRLFADVAFHVSPMATIGAPTLEDLLEGDQGRVFGSIQTPYWATIGCPTVAVPIAPASSGLPLSLQIAGPAYGDRDVLGVAAAFQARSGHHLARPPL